MVRLGHVLLSREMPVRGEAVGDEGYLESAQLLRRAATLKAEMAVRGLTLGLTFACSPPPM